ncbi:tRNA(fMet)-specific endonuclease VapC [Nocardioides sp. AN3]
MARLMRMLDTDVMVELVRGRDVELDRRLQATPDVCVSVVTVAELRLGAARARQPDLERRLVEAALSRLHIEDLSLAAAQRSGDVRAALAEAGTMIGGYDLLIAGHALALGVPLVTRNRRDFERVEGLVIEVW